MDTNRTVWDQEELDHINHNQSKVYISHVEVNEYLKYGIRAHVHEYTNAHCIHSFFNFFHRDFLLAWMHFIAAVYVLWEYIALLAGFSSLYP